MKHEYRPSDELLTLMGFKDNHPTFTDNCHPFSSGKCAPPVNTGLTYEQAYGEECAKRMKDGRRLSMSRRMTGRIPWNKGKLCPQLKGPTAETGRKISMAKKGVKQTPEHTLNHANAIRGRAPWNKGRKTT